MRGTSLASTGAAVAALLVGTAGAQVGSGGTISDGNAYFTQSDSPTDPNGVGSCCLAALRFAGPAGQDQAFQHWWWFRVNGRDFREFAFANANSWNWVGNTGTMSFSDPSFNATMTYVVSQPGTNQSQVQASIVIENISGAELSIDIFSYLDFDLNATIGADSATYSAAGGMTIVDGNVEGFFRAANATAWQMAAFSARFGLPDAAISNLTNSGSPFGPGDWTGAFQWAASIPAAASTTFVSTFGASSPVLGRCELAASCTTVSESACNAAGGVWTEGTGLPCLVGRCCVGDSCSVLTASGCSAASGSWAQGEICPVPGYNLSGTAGAFEDISATGTLAATASTCDDCGQANVPIGFTFNFFENSYSIISIGSNGFVNFGAASGTLANTVFPTATVPNNMIAPFWDDLNPNAAGSGDIYYQTLGAAGSQRFIVQWNGVYRFGTTLPCTFQVILFEGTNNIEFRYSDLPALSGTVTPSIGLENSTGTVGLNIDPNLAYPQPSGFRIVFEPNPENPCASSCTADFNNSGAVTVQDIYDFLTDWNSQSSGGPIIIASADFNGVNGVTVQDLYDFFTAWNTQISDPSCN